MAAAKLSAMVVAHNEEARLDACLSRLKFADEIVVALDRCTDRSKEIAGAHGARIIEGSWGYEGERRNAAQQACSGDWIIEIDADEIIPSELATEMRAAVAVPRGDYYFVPFDNYVGSRLVRYGWGASFGVSAKMILYRRGYKSWGNERLHPKVKMTGARGGFLQQRVRHHVDDDIADMLHRLNRYSTLHALDLRDSGDIGSYRKNIMRIFGRFWKCFVRRQGYKEGGMGLLIAICAGLYPILSYLKARYDLGGVAKD
jgi:glycosyltransferase involved in cell wall biosynthesis